MIPGGAFVRLIFHETGGSTIIERERAEAEIASHPNPASWEIREFVGCRCCGQPAKTWVNRQQGRCERHAGRNPCAIEGCRRTREAPADKDGGLFLADNQWLCAEHWRRYVPPGSRMRRAYLAFFRRAKRTGWTDELRWKFYGFWNQLIRTVRHRAAEGRVDAEEIKRLFGWDIS